MVNLSKSHTPGNQPRHPTISHLPSFGAMLHIWTLEVTKTHKTLGNKKPKIYLIRPACAVKLYSPATREVGYRARRPAPFFLVLPICFFSLRRSLSFSSLRIPYVSMIITIITSEGSCKI